MSSNPGQVPSSTDKTRVPQLLDLRIRINDQCNMRCRHCHVPAQRGALLDFDRFGSQLVEDLQQLGTRGVIISGGEPTLEMDLTCAVADRLIDAGIVSILFTNAYQLADRDLGRLLDAGIFTMHVSLDGIEPTHDWFRRTPGSFLATLANIEAATHMGFHIVVRMTLTRDNIAEVRQVADAAYRAGAAIFKIRPVVPSGRANQAMCPTPEQLAQAVKTVIEVGKERPVSFSPSCFEFIHGAPAEPKSACTGKILHIDPNGDISPCGYVKVPLGNLAQHRLPDVFYGARLNALRSLPLPQVCSACDYVKYCHGGCRACVLKWGFRADEPDTYCPIAAERSRQPYVSGASGGCQIAYQGRGLVELKSLRTGESVVLQPERDRDPGFVVEMGGLRVYYVSNLDTLPIEEDIEVLAPLDVVVALFDGSQACTLSSSILSGLMRRLGARILIPIPAADDDKEAFSDLQAGGKVHRFSGNRVCVDLNSLPQKTETWILTSEGGT